MTRRKDTTSVTETGRVLTHDPLCDSRRDTESGPYLPCSCGASGRGLTPLDEALGLVEQMRTWHTPSLTAACQRCLVADGRASCATSTALAEVALRLRMAGAS